MREARRWLSRLRHCSQAPWHAGRGEEQAERRGKRQATQGEGEGGSEGVGGGWESRKRGERDTQVWVMGGQRLQMSGRSEPSFVYGVGDGGVVGVSLDRPLL